MTSKRGEFSITGEAASYLARPVDERVDYVRRDHWIGYPRAEEIRSKLNDIYRMPRRVRMANLLVVGEGGNGKTHVLQSFLKEHPADDRPDADASSIPLVMVNAPPTPDAGELCVRILRAIGSPVRSSSSKGTKREKVIDELRRVGTRMLMIDEIHDVLSGDSTRQSEILGTIKDFSNELRIPIVAAGTDAARTAIAVDSQLEQRFSYKVLPLWQNDTDFRRLLTSFERLLPFPERSHLAAEAHANTIYDCAGGRIGDISYVIMEAAVLAIRAGKSKISLTHLLEAGKAGPSESRRLAGSA
jgi:hypothetical protein